MRLVVIWVLAILVLTISATLVVVVLHSPLLPLVLLLGLPNFLAVHIVLPIVARPTKETLSQLLGIQTVEAQGLRFAAPAKKRKKT